MSDSDQTDGARDSESLGSSLGGYPRSRGPPSSCAGEAGRGRTASTRYPTGSRGSSSATWWCGPKGSSWEEESGSAATLWVRWKQPSDRQTVVA